MSSENTQRKIERFLKARTLIPVLGPGVITFGEDDRPLYPWLVESVAARLGLPNIPPSLHHLVCDHLRRQGTIEDVCLELDDLLDNTAPEPGPLMRRLASLPQCRHFFTLGFDPLFQRALDTLRGNGRNVTRTWTFGLDRPAADLPALDSVGTFLGYLFGRISANPGFHLWDADAVEFVWQLQRQLPSLNNLGRTLAENNLIFIGTNCSDWLVRFLLRAIRQRPLTEGTGRNFLIADPGSGSHEDAVFFYDSLRRDISMLPVEPLSFARDFCDQALALEPPLTSGRVAGTDLAIPLMEPDLPDGSIFISYAHVDAAAAFKVVEHLRAAGCLVWLDDERLTCGDHFENNLEDAVMKHCSFFVSLISATTESRAEAYFHKERNWAAKRAISMSETRPFYFPVLIDDTPSPLRHEPRQFAKIDFERAVGGEVSTAFCKRLSDLQASHAPH